MRLVLATASSPLALARAGPKRSAVEITEAYLRRLQSVEQKLNAFLAVDGELALQQAADIDRRLAKGEDVGPLAGVCIAIKASGVECQGEAHCCCRRRCRCRSRQGRAEGMPFTLLT